MVAICEIGWRNCWRTNHWSSSSETMARPSPALRSTLCGHRTLLLGPTRPQAQRPPLVLLGGTAQWLDSWSGHLTSLSRERQVLLYETRGQAGATSLLDTADCSLERQVRYQYLSLTCRTDVSPHHRPPPPTIASRHTHHGRLLTLALWLRPPVLLSAHSTSLASPSAGGLRWRPQQPSLRIRRTAARIMCGGSA